jgi:hypothetical protein
VGNAGATTADVIAVNNTGAVGFAGTNYGTSGQILTSGGSATTPSWSSSLASATTATTQADKTATTQIATTAFVDKLRGLLAASTPSTGGTLVVGDRGALVSVTAGVTIPNAVFAAGDAVSIYNNSAASITITQGASFTLRQVGTANTGNRTLALRGLVTVIFISSSEAVISGGGLT